eukprot:3853458-Alexandrium_andersonii.AAC.1
MCIRDRLPLLPLGWRYPSRRRPATRGRSSLWARHDSCCRLDLALHLLSQALIGPFVRTRRTGIARSPEQALEP